MKCRKLAALLLALCLAAAMLPGAVFALTPAAAPTVTFTTAFNPATFTNSVTITIASTTPGATLSGSIDGVAFTAVPSPHVVMIPAIPSAGVFVAATATAAGFDPSALTATTVPAPQASKPVFTIVKEDNFSKLHVVVSSATLVSTITCFVNGEKLTGANPLDLHLTMQDAGLFLTATADAATFSTSPTAEIFLRPSLFQDGVNGVNPQLPELYPEKSAAQFKDVPATAWYRADLDRLVRSGVIEGMTEDTFAPQGPLTMAQFIKMLAVALYGDGVEKYSGYMVDNRYATWYSKYVGAAVAGGLTLGVEISYDKLNGEISRYEMAKLLINAAKTLGEDPQILPDIYRRIADYSEMPLDWRDAVAKAYSAGLLEGYDEYGHFYGSKTLIRCEACAVIVRLFDKDARPEVK